MPNLFPWSNFHELNLDWILEKIGLIDKAEEQTKEYKEKTKEYKEAAEAAKNAAVEAAGSASAAKNYTEGVANRLEGKVEQVDNNTEDIITLSARMDEFTRLENGSTTGDAELADIRVGFNGVTYDTAGDAVRGQFDDVNNINLRTEELTGICWTNGYYDNTGTYQGAPTGSFKVSNYLPCFPGETIIVCGRTDSEYLSAITFFDKTQAIQANADIGTQLTEISVVVPDNAVSFRVSTSKALLNKTYIKFSGSNKKPLYLMHKTIIENRAEIEHIKTPCFVDSENGDDTNAGTSSAPLQSIDEALSRGYEKINVKAGIYPRVLHIVGHKNIDIGLWTNVAAFDTNNPDREKIILFDGTLLTPTAAGGEYSATFTPAPDTPFDKVFVQQTLTPKSSDSYGEYYNVTVFMYKPGIDCRRLEPVLPEDYTGAEGTFTYTGTKIKVTPFGGDLTGAKIAVCNTKAYGIRCEDTDSVHLSDVVVLGTYFYGLRFDGCKDVILDGCEAMCTQTGAGLEVYDSNIKLNNCRNSGNRMDGYSYYRYGESVMNNCYGIYNGDDGVSHHHGTVGVINGGVFKYNGSGGITPAFGAIVNINNVFSRYNKYGVALFGATGYKKRTVYINSCTLLDNFKDIYNDGYEGIFTNCVYETKTSSNPGTNTFYGN